MDDNLMTAKEAAEKLCVSTAIVYRLFHAGELHGHVLAKKAIRFSQEQIDEYRAATNSKNATEG